MTGMPAAGRRRAWNRWRPVGVRWQATVVAVAVVAAALVMGGGLLVLLLHRSVTGNLEGSLTALVAQDVETLQGEGLDALAASETDRGADGVLVQVLDATGRVRFTTEPTRSTPATELRPAPGQTLVAGRTVVPVPGRVAAPLQVAEGVVAAGEPLTVVAVASQEPLEDAVDTTGLLLAAGIPLMVLLTGLLTWWRVGDALRSVDSIRAQVDTIGVGADLGQRVPVPAGRDEVAELATTMNRMLQRLETADRSQRQFVADASHELRSPFATLTASLDVAGQDPAGSAWTGLSPVLRAETDRMTQLVEDLLLLSRVDHHGPSPSPVEVDLDDLVGQEARRLRQVSGMPVTVDAQPVKVSGDDHQLTRLLRNLFDNAANAATSRVRCTVSVEDSVAVVVVEDDGPGIAPEDRARVFERFVRLDEARSRDSGGSGLGLAIVAEIAHAHGGTVTVGGSRLGGALLELRLPALR